VYADVASNRKTADWVMQTSSEDPDQKGSLRKLARWLRVEREKESELHGVVTCKDEERSDPGEESEHDQPCSPPPKKCKLDDSLSSEEAKRFNSNADADVGSSQRESNDSD